MPDRPEIYFTVDHPNDSPKDGTIHPIALEQLAPYQAIAPDWPRYPDGRAIRCGKCDQSLWFTYDAKGKPYIYEDHEKLGLIVGHIRRNHSEAVSESH